MITKRWLKNNDACKAGIEWFMMQQDKSDEGLLNACIKDGHLLWANWVVARKLEKTGRVKYAVYAAEQVLELYTSKYPGDDRPRKAIAAAKKYIEKPTAKNKYAADAAARAAADAAARAAADAARAAAEVMVKILKYGMQLLKNEQSKGLPSLTYHENMHHMS